MNLRYTDPAKGAKAQWSGNISEWDWVNGGSNYTYAISYDDFSRFVSADLYNGASKTNAFLYSKA